MLIRLACAPVVERAAAAATWRLGCKLALPIARVSRAG